MSMNNLPAIIPETPQWFLWEIEDLLELLKKSDKKESNSIVSIDEFQYIQTLPKRLFQCKFINAAQMHVFSTKIHKSSIESKNSIQFLLTIIFYIFQSGLLENELEAFKNMRDTLIAVVKDVTNAQKLIEKKVAAIITIDNKFFPEVLPGEVVGSDWAIIDSVYTNLENASDSIIPILYQEDYAIEKDILIVYAFYGELLSLGYIDEAIYKNVIEAEKKHIKTAVCVWILHAFSAWFYDSDYSLKESLAYLIREYLLENQERKLMAWAEETFTKHEIILWDYTTSP